MPYFDNFDLELRYWDILQPAGCVFWLHNYTERLNHAERLYRLIMKLQFFIAVFSNPQCPPHVWITGYVAEDGFVQRLS